MKTKHILLFGFFVFTFLLVFPQIGQTQTSDNMKTNFIDLDGDGFNDNAPDHDGDGIPNSIDQDYRKLAQKGINQQNGNLAKHNNANSIKDKLHKFQMRKRFGFMDRSRFQFRTGRDFSNHTTFDHRMFDGSGPNGGSDIHDGKGPHRRRGHDGR